MVDRAAKQMLFREQTQKLLNVTSARRVKEVLGCFMRDQQVEKLVEGLAEVLDEPAKLCLWSTIGYFIPEQFSEAFAVASEAASENVHAVGRELDDDANTAASSDGDRAAYDNVDAFNTTAAPNAYENWEIGAPGVPAAPTTTTTAPRRAAPPIPEVSLDQEEQYLFVDIATGEGAGFLGADTGNTKFDEVMAMVEADMVATAEHRTGRRGLSHHDILKSQDDAALRDRQRRAKAQAAAPRRQVSVNAATGGWAGFDGCSTVDENTSIVPGDGYIVECNSRDEAEAVLTENGATPGSFLVRKKDLSATSAAASFKRNPRQPAPQRSWALSFVQEDSTFSHQLIIDGDILNIGGKELGHCSSLAQLINYLKTAKQYELTQAPYQAQTWYHGAISRAEAEKRLFKNNFNGRYLVRKSTTEQLTLVISELTAGKVRHHKLLFDGLAWTFAAAPGRGYRTVQLLLTANIKRGLRLVEPCARP